MPAIRCRDRLSSPLSSLPSFTKTQLLPLFLTAMFDICNNFHKIEIFVWSNRKSFMPCPFSACIKRVLAYRREKRSWWWWLKESEINKVKCALTSAPQWWRHKWKLQALQCVEASGKVQIVDFAGTPHIWIIVSGPYVSMMVTASCLSQCLRTELMVSMLNVHLQTTDALFDTRLK